MDGVPYNYIIVGLNFVNMCDLLILSHKFMIYPAKF